MEIMYSIEIEKDMIYYLLDDLGPECGGRWFATGSCRKKARI